ncbi:hypothetical protein FOA52_006114 [Chlamydomonas sp. UWO 241]|nr:hypothetical protein FOA52_006114 [Chlamydomonas sp. UWO 241]
MIKTIRDAGGVVNARVGVQTQNAGPRGVSLSARVSKRTVLVGVPAALMMTSESGRCIQIGNALSGMPSWGELVERMLSDQHGTPEDQQRAKLCLTVWVAAERKRGAGSPWHWFLSGFPPSTGNLPRRFTGHDAQLLGGSMAALIARTFAQEDAVTYRVLAAELGGGMLGGVTEDEYAWASDINAMRVFIIPGNRPGMHTGSSKPPTALAMVPLADMFNHAHRADYNCRWKFNVATRMFEIKAGQDLSRDTQLTVSYGPTKTNAMLFQLFGFVMEPPETRAATSGARYTKVTEQKMVTWHVCAVLMMLI